MNCCCEVTTANAGGDQVLCDTWTTLEGNKPTVGCGKWTVVSGAGTFAYPRKYNTKVRNLGEGANVFKWTISAKCSCPCSEDSEDTVTITKSC